MPAQFSNIILSLYTVACSRPEPSSMMQHAHSLRLMRYAGDLTCSLMLAWLDLAVLPLLMFQSGNRNLEQVPQERSSQQLSAHNDGVLALIIRRLLCPV